MNATNSTHIEADPLQLCEQEKLQYSGAVQAHGLTIIIDDDQKITAIGGKEDVGLLNRPQIDCLGAILQDCITAPLTVEGNAAAGSKNRQYIYGLEAGADETWDVVITNTEVNKIIEFLPRQAHAAALPHDFARVMKKPESLDQLFGYESDFAEIMHRTLGFEKVMIYQFQPDWSGEVIAEFSASGHFDQYLGLRFPASDIPQIARDLYVKTPYRLIADASGAVAPLHYENQGLDQVPDLTYSDLRSVSPVHLAYLANMGVGASLSFPIVLNKKLWGLVACHHPTSNSPNLESLNMGCDLTGMFVTSLGSLFADERLKAMTELDDRIQSILNALNIGSDQPPFLSLATEDILDLMGATGAAFISNDKIHRFGDAPDKDFIANIDRQLKDNEEETVFSSESLAASFPELSHDANLASGLMAIDAKAANDHGDLRFHWYRAELPRVIKWAGDPNKTLQTGNPDMPISPRKSFESWTETTKGHSAPWSATDQAAAVKFRAMVLRMLR